MPWLLNVFGDLVATVIAVSRPMDTPKKPISSYDNADQLRQIMFNAKRQSNMEVYWEAFRRVCQLEGSSFSDPLEREFYATLAAYEELLAEKHGRRQPAARTRQKLANKGYVACLEDWAVSAKRTEGFTALIQAGKKELTGEFLVAKYPERFSPEAVRNARMILELLEQDL